jgi:hypothetical protein
MSGVTVDEQRFQWREKIARGICVGPLAREKLRAQFLLDRRGAGNFGTAAFQALERDRKVAARRRGQSPQKIPDLVNVRHGRQFPQSMGCQRSARRPQASSRVRNQEKPTAAN